MGNKFQPLVSVIMPVYNGEPYLSEAIRSVLAQSYPHWELLIVNDGSTDRSEGSIRDFRDERIRYFPQKNRGVSAARNRGLMEMRGEFFLFLDADDVLTPHSLEARLEVFRNNKDVAFVDGRVWVTGSDLGDIKREWVPDFRGDPTRQLLGLSERCFVTISWMVRRVPGVEFRFAEDMTHSEDLWFFLEHAHLGEYDHTERDILYFRRTGSSAMSNMKGLEKGYWLLLEKARERFGLSVSQQGIMMRKIRRIMIRSYLKNFQLLAACRVFFQFKTEKG